MLENRVYDTGRDTGGYCTHDSCNIWGSKNTLYDVNMNPITSLAKEINGTKYALPAAEAETNSYLNQTYYNTFDLNARKMIIDSIYNVGLISTDSSQTTQDDIKILSTTKWKGKIALINILEYVRANSYDSCSSVNMYREDSSCYNNGANWLSLGINDSWWTMSPETSSSYTTSLWNIGSLGNISTGFTSTKNGIRPVVTLSPEVKITGGNGSQNNPYQLS